MIVGIFSIDPPTLTFTCDDHTMARAQQCREQQQLVIEKDLQRDANCPLNTVNNDTIFKVFTWLDETSLCLLSSSCRKFLVIGLDNELWAHLYLTRSPGIACFDEHLSPDIGPTRVLTLGPDLLTRQWTWSDARER